MNQRTEDTKSIIKKIAEDDHDAFRIFYDLYYLKIYRYVSTFIKNKNMREETVSDVFFHFWQNRKNNPNIENLEGYLYRMARNTALSYLNNLDEGIMELAELPYEKASSSDTPEDILIREEMSVAIKKAIDSLPERCRLIFLMSREKGLKYREIADLLSISEKTVNAQIVLAIKKLTTQLGKLLTLFFTI